MPHSRFFLRFLIGLVFTFWAVGCISPTATSQAPTSIPRESLIPGQAVKMSPASDDHPPQVLTLEYEQPIPLPGAVNTAGGEDSPFVTPDGNSLYFFFTPDITIPAEQQLLDGVTGLYVSYKENDLWGVPERILLQEKGKLALDGCEFVQEAVMWFCSSREGYEGIHWFTANFMEGKWQNWQIADFPPAYQVGELHITHDGDQLYFHSTRPGGKGGLDIWVSDRLDSAWSEPVNLASINTEQDEGWPAISPDGQELWFTSLYSIWRSKKAGGVWGPAEQIISGLAGEPSLDNLGNVYFVHHFFKDGTLIEADIYFARKK